MYTRTLRHVHLHFLVCWYRSVVRVRVLVYYNIVTMGMTSGIYVETMRSNCKQRELRVVPGAARVVRCAGGEPERGVFGARVCVRVDDVHVLVDASRGTTTR